MNIKTYTDDAAHEADTRLNKPTLRPSIAGVINGGLEAMIDAALAEKSEQFKWRSPLIDFEPAGAVAMAVFKTAVNCTQRV